MQHDNIYPCTELVSGVAVAEQSEQAENTRIRDLTVTLTPVLLYTIMHTVLMEWAGLLQGNQLLMRRDVTFEVYLKSTKVRPCV